MTTTTQDLRTTVQETTPRWAAQQRQAFIRKTLAEKRCINRADIVAAFGISKQQATTDLSRYLKDNPADAKYDSSLKTFVANTSLTPHATKALDDDNYFTILGILGREYSKLTGEVHGLAMRNALDAIRPHLAPRPVAVDAEVLAMLKKYRVAASRMCDRWSEADQAAKNQLWKELHSLESDALEIIDRAATQPPKDAEIERLREALKQAALELWEAADKLHILHCDLPKNAPADYKSLSRKWTDRACNAARAIKTVLASTPPKGTDQ